MRVGAAFSGLARAPGPRCSVHDVPIHTPESWDEHPEPHCPICHVRDGEQYGAWTPERLALRSAMADAVLRNFGKEVWGDPEFVDTWRHYQLLALDLSGPEPTFLAGMLVGVWTLRNIKRETMEARNMRRRVKETLDGVERGLAKRDRHTDLEPTLAPRQKKT